eukprot:2465054-Amphidinium_carterae.3
MDLDIKANPAQCIELSKHGETEDLLKMVLLTSDGCTPGERKEEKEHKLERLSRIFSTPSVGHTPVLSFGQPKRLANNRNCARTTIYEKADLFASLPAFVRGMGP